MSPPALAAVVDVLTLAPSVIRMAPLMSNRMVPPRSPVNWLSDFAEMLAPLGGAPAVSAEREAARMVMLPPGPKSELLDSMELWERMFTAPPAVILISPV